MLWRSSLTDYKREVRISVISKVSYFKSISMFSFVYPTLDCIQDCKCFWLWGVVRANFLQRIFTFTFFFLVVGYFRNLQ